MAVKNIIFNGLDLQSANIIVTKIDDENIPARELRRYNISRGDGEIITDSRFGAKRITVIGRLTYSSSSLLEYSLDDFRSALTGVNTENKVLDIDYQGSTRRYNKATCTSLVIDRRTGTANLAEFTAEFISVVPFAENTVSTPILASLIMAASPYTNNIGFAGTAWQKPIIELTINSFTGASINTIVLKNNTTLRNISVSRAWTAGDVLRVDVANMTVKVNGVDVDYGGIFPEFAPGNTDLIYSDDFSARNVSIKVDCTLRYI